MGGVCTASERWGKGTSLGGEKRNRSTILNANVLIFKVISYLPLQVRRDVSDLKFPTPANKSKEHSLKKKKEKTLQGRLHTAVSTFKHFLPGEAKPNTQQKTDCQGECQVKIIASPKSCYRSTRSMFDSHYISGSLHFFEDYFCVSFRAFSTQLSPLEPSNPLHLHWVLLHLLVLLLLFI